MLLGAKVVGNVKVAGVGNNTKNLTGQFNKHYELGTIASGPGKLRFFGINTVQNEDMTISTGDDDIFNSFNEYSLTHIWRKKSDELINNFEKSIQSTVDIGNYRNKEPHSIENQNVGVCL